MHKAGNQEEPSGMKKIPYLMSEIIEDVDSSLVFKGNSKYESN